MSCVRGSDLYVLHIYKWCFSERPKDTSLKIPTRYHVLESDLYVLHLLYSHNIFTKKVFVILDDLLFRLTKTVKKVDS